MACLKFLEAHPNRHNWIDTHTHHMHITAMLKHVEEGGRAGSLPYE